MQRRKPLLIGLSIFLLVAVLSQLLTYQQYLLYENAERERVLNEANAVSDKIKTSLSHSLSATKTLAFIVKKYGVPNDFDSVAKEILASNRFIDAVELTRGGVITHVHPYEDNREAIGYDVLADSTRSEEARKALDKRELFFAGPFELKQGGMAVVGRLPIFIDGEFFGFSAVLVRLSTLIRAAGIDVKSEKFAYQLSKQNPSTGREEFFLADASPSTDGQQVSIQVPDGEWKLSVISRDRFGYVGYILPYIFMGLILSLVSGVFGWHLGRQSEVMHKRIEYVTNEMTEYQKTATQSLHRISRLFQFTSRLNDMMVHARHPDELFARICQIAIEIGKFRMAWIGLINEKEQKLEAVSFAGEEQGYLAEIAPIPLTMNDLEGPALRMIRSEKYVHCNDIANDPLMKPWAGKALTRGFKSSMLLPIRRSGKIVGSFNLYSSEPNSFDDNEVKLLVEACDNISFTLDNFEKEKSRTVAERQIQAEKLMSDSVINSLPGVFYLYDKNGKFIRWNKNFEEVSGYTYEEVASMHPLDFFQGEEKQLLRQRIADVFVTGEGEVIANFTSKDGHTTPFYFNGRRVSLEGVDYLIGMGLDITDRVQAERSLRERTDEIEKLSAHLQNVREEERSYIALEIHDVLGQQLTALKMDINWLKKRITADEVTGGRMTAMTSLVDDTIKTVRRISSELRPGILDDLGLVAALEWQGADFEKNTGIPLVFKSNTNDLDLERGLSTNVFRVYQEALTNVARHSDATEVQASFLHQENSIRLIVRDNGKGIDVEEARTKKSLGLISMKERARMFRGEVTVERNFPQGTVVTLTMPFERSKT
jgi:PAS domain S-box-containing protein